MVGQYLASLGLTLAIEVPVYLAVLARLAGVPWPRALIAAVAVNALSHPLFTYGLLPLADRWLPDTASVVAGEVVVCALEAALLCAWLRAEVAAVAAASLLANGASLAGGLIVLSGLHPGG